MEPNDSGEQPERSITIRLTPENLILAAAVLFLLTAVVLAVVFSLGSPSTPVTVTGTATAGVGSGPTTDANPRATASGENPGGYPVPTSGGIATLPTFETQPYPGPNEPNPATTPTNPPNDLPGNVTVVATSPAVASVPTNAVQQTTTGPTSVVPTFEPSRATASSGGNGGSYPPPATFAPVGPTVAVATLAPTATQQPTAATATSAPQATAVVFPTAQAQPTQQPRPTSEPAGGADAPPTNQPRATATAVPPTEIPIDVVRGTVRWSANQSPITLRRDLQVSPGSTLVIEPGVEVRMAPGVAIYVDGKLYASGQEGNPVRFSSFDGQRWDAIYGRSGGDIGMSYVNISGGGSGGTLISSQGGNLSLSHATVRDNGGQIRALDSRVDIRNSDISGNDMPYGAAVEASYSTGGGVILQGNRIGGNRQAAGAPPVQLRNESSYDTLNLDAQSNLLVGRNGPSLVIYTNGAVRGTLSCNALMNGSDGLMIKTGTVQVAPEIAITIANNAIEDQTPPIIPIYLKYGIGRGATSDIYIDMRNNWWRSAEGPYHPDLHADGRGEAVGSNITFEPWLTERPACAPRP